MAQTEKGTQFYVIEFTAKEEGQDLEELEAVLRKHVRAGDGVFIWEERILIAVVGEVVGAGTVARRFLQLLKRSGIGSKVSLIPEPFGDELMNAALEVILGRVPIVPRRDTKGGETKRITWKG